MKRPYGTVHGMQGGVAPLTGAWIETIDSLGAFRARSVAPLTGAWIETNWAVFFGADTVVAPLTGAWIETQ